MSPSAVRNLRLFGKCSFSIESQNEHQYCICLLLRFTEINIEFHERTTRNGASEHRSPGMLSSPNKTQN